MQDQKSMEREFQALAEAIARLRQYETELAELKPPPDVFGAQIESIRSKLKRPGMVDEVGQELDAIRKQLAASTGATVEISTIYTRSSLPRELGHLYYDASFIGSGGFGQVFRARRKADGVEVAVKVPSNFDASTGKSFIAEVYAWQMLRHHNIVRILDFNILPIPYLEMELCQRSLNELPKPVDVKRAVALVFQIAEGIRCAHSQNIVHRDLKPQNILLMGDIPKISDWGLSKVVAESRVSKVYRFSPLYAAPEQFAPQRFGNPDHRTDIYQLGAIFYEVLTGEPPFRSDNIVELMGQIVNSEPVTPSAHSPSVGAVEHIAMKCLRKEMNERYQSIANMQTDLADHLEGERTD